MDCPCGFGPHYEVGAFSRRWHELHREHHLDVFPDVDQGTRDNLAMFIQQARPTIEDAMAAINECQP